MQTDFKTTTNMDNEFTKRDGTINMTFDLNPMVAIWISSEDLYCKESYYSSNGYVSSYMSLRSLSLYNQWAPGAICLTLYPFN